MRLIFDVWNPLCYQPSGHDELKCILPAVQLSNVAVFPPYRELKKLMTTSEVDLDEVRMMALCPVYGIWDSD